MFVQVIEGHTSDPSLLFAALDRWIDELRPGAAGFLGSTAGVTPEGRAFVIARFESAESAAANSERPEQQAWWAGAAESFDGDVTFAESTEVDTFLGGGSDAAGFVQIMKDSGADREGLRSIDALFEEHADFRPDVLGGIRAWTGPGAYIEAAYFSSEAEAREAEQKSPPPELAAALGDLGEMMANVEFIDLTALRLVS